MSAFWWGALVGAVFALTAAALALLAAFLTDRHAARHYDPGSRWPPGDELPPPPIWGDEPGVPRRPLP